MPLVEFLKLPNPIAKCAPRYRAPARAPAYNLYWNLAKTRYRVMVTRCRYILILDPISGTILQTPDIGYFPISGIPISGMTRYRVSRYRVIPDIRIYRYRDQCPDIVSVVYPISSHPVFRCHAFWSRYRAIVFPDIVHDVSCSQQFPGPGLVPAFRLLPPACNS